jgi:hypothetical protein
MGSHVVGTTERETSYYACDVTILPQANLRPI